MSERSLPIPDSLRPAVWVVAGMALVAVSDNFIPLVARHMGLWQLQAMRAVAALPFVLLFVLVSGRMAELRPRSPWRMAVRSALSIVGLMFYFAALPSVPMAQAAAGLFTSPIWVSIFLVTIFRERVSPRRVAAVLLGFAGVCVVQGVGMQPVHPMALVAVIGGAFFALSVIWTRRQCSEESATGMAFWQFVGFLISGLIGFALAPVLSRALAGVEGTEFATQGWAGMSLETIGLVAFIGLSGVVATACIAVGYKTGEPSLVGLFDFSFLLWAPLFAWVLWDQSIQSRAGIGMVMIFSAGALATMPSWRFAKRLDPSG